MKSNRTYLFITLSSIALVLVLVIQVNWILEAAHAKEQLFNEKANIVLARTTEALYADKATCKKMENCVGKDERHKIDSLFLHYMKYYNFQIDYSFEVLKPFRNQENNLLGTIYPNDPGCYRTPLDEVYQKNGWALKLIFPKKTAYIKREISLLFITSIFLILIVLFLFWHTLSSLLREKKISEHTNDFLNNMTHEFKTPLTNIALAGKMILKDHVTIEANKIKHYTEVILQENERLNLQVEQVLRMTALERGEIPLQKSRLDFHQLIKDSIKCMNLQLENSQVNVELNLHATTYFVLADKNHFINVFCNLIDNAIKYGGGKQKLIIQSSQTDKKIIVSVKDQGIGIKKEYQLNIFDKYFRVPTGDIHTVKGFGLGLAYVKKIIELHGGKVDIQSEEKKGSTFIITLPLTNHKDEI